MRTRGQKFRVGPRPGRCELPVTCKPWVTHASTTPPRRTYHDETRAMMKNAVADVRVPSQSNRAGRSLPWMNHGGGNSCETTTRLDKTLREASRESMPQSPQAETNIRAYHHTTSETRTRTPGEQHRAEAPGEKHLARSTWRETPGEKHLARSTWREAPGEKHLAKSTTADLP